jgi:hypothetical protein
MATVQSLTKARMEDIEAASVVSGEIDVSGHLILTTHGGTDIDAGYVLGSIPDASDTVKGIVELATVTESTTGTDTIRAVTPAGLSAAITAAAVPDASTTVKGKVELATSAETTTGSDTVRAVTPAGLAAALAAFLGTIYPVGSIYISTVSTNPNTLFGVGTWSAIGGQFLIGADGTYTAASTGGAATKTLSSGEMPSHTHAVGTLATASDGVHKHAIGVDGVTSTGTGKFAINVPGSANGDAGSIEGTFDSPSHTHSLSGSTASTGSGSSFSILPPYVAVYMWKRTA